MRVVVGFSGGVDSQACALWCRQRFGDDGVTLLNSDVGGHEHPLTYAFTRWYAENVFPVTVVTPLVRDLGDVGNVNPEIARRRATLGEDSPLTFADLAWVKLMFPSSKIRFCTEYLKLAPQKRWLAENASGGYERYIGVRADESPGRSRLTGHEWDPYFDCDLYRPLLHWSKEHCFAYLSAHGEEVNPLYRMGAKRVGCSPCVGAGKEEIREWAARFPGEVERVRQMERRVGKPFFEGKAPAGLAGWVDEMVAWSKTARGGKQFSLPFVEAEAAAGVCSSKYGLCE
jgi:3'-phosphoadenosine 5'-phosphosulfate sulfotransferase (PAPS reductase)/FAD synthetase